MGDTQTPAQIEQSVFVALKAVEQQIHTYLDSCPTGASAQVIGTWINGLDDYLWRLLQLNASTQRLSTQGLPSTAQYLQAMARDFAGARQQYSEMYQDTVASQSRWPGIWNDANQFAINNILQATQYQQAVFQTWQKGYFDINENRCFDCQRIIGIPGGGYCIDCARKRGLIA